MFDFKLSLKCQKAHQNTYIEANVLIKSPCDLKTAMIKSFFLKNFINRPKGNLTTETGLQIKQKKIKRIYLQCFELP